MKKRLKTQQKQKVTSAEQSSPQITDEDLTRVMGGRAPGSNPMNRLSHVTTVYRGEINTVSMNR